MNVNNQLPLWIRKLLMVLPEVLVIVVFFSLQLQHINIDFWNDEIYTLKHFTFVPLEETVTDYHVPNNHIFFNLINNIYLEIINVSSLHSLMDAPYKLRVVPFIYSFFTVLITYKVGVKFFNRNVAIISCIALITTLPYYSFSLQIRGYGLSTLLLLVIVYYCFSYLKSDKKRHLFLISVFSLFLFYTIPSNIYALACILFVLGLYWLLSAIKQIKNEGGFNIRAIINEKYVRLILAIVTGLLISLLLYYPIFEDVFMNEYVVSGSPFQFSKLYSYFSKVIPSMFSGRLLFLLSCLVLLILLIRKRKIQFSLVMIIALCFIPLTFPFFRGDQAPLRVFTVFSPYYAVLFAVSIYRSWNIFSKNSIFSDYGLIALIVVYSLFTFNHKFDKASAHLLDDIKGGDRSQDLDHQYYSHHYQPLKEIKQLKERYKKGTPVIIDGCEPHGVSNYLEKFDIPYSSTYYQPNVIDSMISLKDSIYIITNHPNSYEKINEYRKVKINESLSYHNVLLLHRKLSVEKVIKHLKVIKEKYRDSISFVLNVYNKSFFEKSLDVNSTYFVDKENQVKYGELISLKDKKPYLCYLETYGENSLTINAILRDGRKITAEYEFEGLTNSFYVSKKEKTSRNASVLFYNDFEKETEKNTLRDSTNRYSGVFSEKLDDNNIYSTGFTHSLKEMTSSETLLVSFFAKFKKNSEAIVVLSLSRGGEQILWQGQRVDAFFQPHTNWQEVVTVFQLDANITQINDQVKLYVWNPEKETIWIDDFKVESKN